MGLRSCAIFFRLLTRAVQYRRLFVRERTAARRSTCMLDRSLCPLRLKHFSAVFFPRNDMPSGSTVPWSRRTADFPSWERALRSYTISSTTTWKSTPLRCHLNSLADMSATWATHPPSTARRFPMRVCCVWIVFSRSITPKTRCGWCLAASRIKKWKGASQN